MPAFLVTFVLALFHSKPSASWDNQVHILAQQVPKVILTLFGVSRLTRQATDIMAIVARVKHILADPGCGCRLGQAYDTY
jgi:hypothetical protein